jgi:hypothetical protein
MSMSEQGTWYTAIPKRDRAAVDAAAKWLAPVPWQYFVTLTFPWNVREETADSKFRQFMNTVERELRHSVCFVVGKERKPQSVGMEVPCTSICS